MLSLIIFTTMIIDMHTICLHYSTRLFLNSRCKNLTFFYFCSMKIQFRSTMHVFSLVSTHIITYLKQFSTKTGILKCTARDSLLKVHAINPTYYSELFHLNFTRYNGKGMKLPDQNGKQKNIIKHFCNTVQKGIKNVLHPLPSII